MKLKTGLAVFFAGSSLCGCSVPGEKTFDLVTVEELQEEQTVTEVQEEKETKEKEGDSREAEAEQPLQIYVDVSGEVANPGVYQLVEGARVFQAIEAAGGITENACMRSVNQARVLSDEDRVWIPDEQYAEEHPEDFPEEDRSSENTSGQKTDQININRASAEELMTLSGIGRAKAEAIVDYREKHGNYQSIEEIMKIEGIKDGTFLKIKDRISVG